MDVLKERWMTHEHVERTGPAGAGSGARELARRLRPAKVRGGLRRRWFEFTLERTPLRDCNGVETVGNPAYGGWRIPAHLIEPGWVCYCVGAGGDVSFDLGLIARYGVTVRCVEPVAKYVDLARKQAAGDPHFSVYRAAIATEDGPLRMQITHDPASSSVSPARLYDSDAYVELPGRTLPSLMTELGDARIDLLKLDIEGGEYEVLPTLDLRGLGVKVFAVQLHHAGSVAQAKSLIAQLAEQGYAAVARRPAVKIAFVREDLLDGH
jgi:FkbM family methyltransferase